MKSSVMQLPPFAFFLVRSTTNYLQSVWICLCFSRKHDFFCFSRIFCCSPCHPAVSLVPTTRFHVFVDIFFLEKGCNQHALHNCYALPDKPFYFDSLKDDRLHFHLTYIYKRRSSISDFNCTSFWKRSNVRYEGGRIFLQEFLCTWSFASRVL